jgi:glycosyltransferase involved in cell wall biosynthesis
MRPIRSVSVLVPTWQGTAFLERALDALAAQRLGLPWDLYAVDSGSTDGTWELLGRAAQRFPVPLRRERIDPVEFDHGDTRNLLAARTSGDLLVYLTQDAIPSGPDWLATIAANFEDPRVAAAYCRNVPRASADLLTRVNAANDPGYAPGRREVRIDDRAAYERMSPLERRILCNFNDVASAVRREVWELHPFPRTAFGEDVLMARALLEAGFTVVYDDQATVEHSHDFGPEETRARATVDGRFNAEWLGRICFESRAQARAHVALQVEKDREALAAAGLAGRDLAEGSARAVRLRTAAFEGLHEGGLSPRRRAATRLLAQRELSILYVVHGFPPDTWAGTEVYTLNLAREMSRRGHRVTILARAPGDAPDFSVVPGEFEGLRVLRLVHRLEHRSLRDTYERPEVDRAFRAVLDAERPDLVHFMHLIHLSAGLVDAARERGLPTLITCHDFWSICARVQLIRPDGVRCEENMGSGCFLCVKERNLGRIEALKRLDSAARPLLSAVGQGDGVGKLAPAGLRRRFEGFLDLADRHEAVLSAYRRADLRISPSRFLRQKLVDTAGFDPETFLYSDNGVRTESLRGFAKRPDPEGRVRFGFVGSLVWYKGAEVMLRAMQRLQGTRAVLSVHGDFDPGRDPHHAALARLAGPNVSFRGRFDNAKLSGVYAEIDVLLVPSLWWENSPVTIHEAFLTGTPVVASGIGGMAEYVRDGIDGLHFAVGDDLDLAARMRRFLDEPYLAAELARGAPAVKTIEQDAAATEARYRALCCIVRDAGEARA